VNFANNSINITSGSTVNITSKTINMNAATINMNAGDINATAGINKEGGGGNFKLKADKEMDTTVGGHKFNLNAEGNTVALTSSNELSVSGVLVKINGGQVQINKT
jgi:hypothetical protein